MFEILLVLLVIIGIGNLIDSIRWQRQSEKRMTILLDILKKLKEEDESWP